MKESDFKWIKCPGCPDEFVNLMKFPYGDGKELSMCPACAYTVSGMALIANEIPIPEANLVPLKPGMLKVAIGPRHFLLFDNHPDYIVVTDSYAGGESRVKARGTIRAWRWIQKRLVEVTTPEVKVATPKTPASKQLFLKQVLDGKQAGGGDSDAA